LNFNEIGEWQLLYGAFGLAVPKKNESWIDDGVIVTFEERDVVITGIGSEVICYIVQQETYTQKSQNSYTA